MDALIMFLVGGFVLYSMIHHGRRLTQSNLYAMRVWGKLFTLLGVIMMFIYIIMVIRSVIQIITK